MALRRVKARYTNGVLEPEEPLGLEEGVEVEVTVDEHVHATEAAEDAALGRAIEEGLTTERVSEGEIARALSPDEAHERLRSLAGAWEGHVDDPDELIRMLYEARIEGSREPPKL